MKKLFTLSIVIAAAALVVFASCEKNKTYSYVCTCTVNQFTNGQNNQVHTFTVTDATTNNVQSKCDMQMNAVLNNSGQSFSCSYK